jgi:hypothetical protein
MDPGLHRVQLQAARIVGGYLSVSERHPQSPFSLSQSGSPLEKAALRRGSALRSTPESAYALTKRLKPDTLLVLLCYKSLKIRRIS